MTTLSRQQHHLASALSHKLLREHLIVALRGVLFDLEGHALNDMGSLSFAEAKRYHDILDQFRTLVYDIEG